MLSSCNNNLLLINNPSYNNLRPLRSNFSIANASALTRSSPAAVSRSSSYDTSFEQPPTYNHLLPFLLVDTDNHAAHGITSGYLLPFACGGDTGCGTTYAEPPFLHHPTTGLVLLVVVVVVVTDILLTTMPTFACIAISPKINHSYFHGIQTVRHRIGKFSH
jgi:hypothetical protein